MTPAIREIRRNFPHAKITLTILGRLHSLAERCPYVNEVIINNIPGASDQVSLLRNMTEFCNQHFWHKRYRLAIVLKGTTDWIPHLYLYLSGARERVNFVHLADRIYTDTVRPKDRSPSYLFLTHPVLYPKNIIHEAERNLYLLKAYGLQVRSNHAELWYETSDLYQARKILGNFGKNKVRVVVAVGTSGAQRENRYPIEQYLKAFKKMIELGAAIIISGGSAEKKSAEFLQNNLPSNAVLNLCELGLTWNTTAAIIAQSDTYIGNDTGPLHLSVACRKPVIALYRDAKYRPALYNGVSSYFRFFPFQNYAIPLQPKLPLSDCAQYLEKFYHAHTCFHEGKVHCITQIKPEEIIEAFARIVNFSKYARKFGGFPTLRNIKPISGSNLLADFKRQKSFLEVDPQAEFAGIFDFIRGDF